MKVGPISSIGVTRTAVAAAAAEGGSGVTTRIIRVAAAVLQWWWQWHHCYKDDSSGRQAVDGKQWMEGKGEQQWRSSFFLRLNAVGFWRVIHFKEWEFLRIFFWNSRNMSSQKIRGGQGWGPSKTADRQETPWPLMRIVWYHTNTSCLASIRKLPALRGWYFGWYYWLLQFFPSWRVGRNSVFEQIWRELLYSSKRGLGCIKKGANALLLSEKGVSTKFTIPKSPTEFSFGIGTVNTGKIPTDTNQKYQITIKLYHLVWATNL